MNWGYPSNLKVALVFPEDLWKDVQSETRVAFARPHTQEALTQILRRLVGKVSTSPGTPVRAAVPVALVPTQTLTGMLHMGAPLNHMCSPASRVCYCLTETKSRVNVSLMAPHPWTGGQAYATYTPLGFADAFLGPIRQTVTGFEVHIILLVDNASTDKDVARLPPAKFARRAG